MDGCLNDQILNPRAYISWSSKIGPMDMFENYDQKNDKKRKKVENKKKIIKLKPESENLI